LPSIIFVNGGLAMPQSASRENPGLTPAPVLPPDPESLDQVLWEELARLRPKFPSSPAKPSSSGIEPSSAPAKWWRWLFPLAWKPETEEEEVSHTRATELFEQNLTALCLSGGGIRSASFCLGILQALAKRKLLSRFDYLSTVSGGGYIGSWLSAWRSRDGQSIGSVEDSLALTGKPKSKDNVEWEPDEVTSLRDFTSYLTPSRGLLSSDTWAGFATLIRNLILNWTLFLPLLLLLVWVPKVTVVVFELCRNWLLAPGGAAAIPKAIVVVFEWLRNVLVPGCGGDQLLGSPAFWLLTAAAALYFVSEVLISWQMIRAEQPPQKEQQSNSDKPPPPYGAGQGWYVVWGLLPTYIAAGMGSVVLVIALPAGDGCWAFVCLYAGQFALWGALLWGLPFAIMGALLFKAPPGSLSPNSSWERWKRRLRFPWLVFARALSGAAFGIVMVLAVALLRYLASPSQYDDRYVVVFGISGFFLAHLAGSTLFAGLSTVVRDFDAVREWTARAGGWFLVSGLVWTVYASLVLWDPDSDWPGPLFPKDWAGWVHLVVASGGLISGIASALFGHSPSTPAQGEGQKSGRKGINWNSVAAAGAVFFSVVVIFELSRAFDWAVLPDSQSFADLTKCHLTACHVLASFCMRFGIALIVLLIWLGAASIFINVNKFSLHTYYRNRLIRCYLGASNKSRWPNAFTGFDEGDNLKMAELHKELHKGKPDKLLHVINITLNLVYGKRLAWQERKATSFTVSPLAAGNPHLGYRLVENYGNEITIGTAMAISGAAASPSMGYHSSPPLALLMTLFNVRLGWWLGNPARPKWTKPGPRGFLPFIMELFGLTDDEKNFVYLSDGGHFENLGIYEMLRRRCRTIVAVDAACDPQLEYEDLGNAIRKARIDFGVEVSFSDPLTPSPDRIATRLGLITSPTPPARSPYCAIGRIRYPGISAEGTLIYIKAAIHGDEPEDILSYAAACNTFPHESTLDQFFTESKFESYRRLGLYIGSAVFSRQHEDGSEAVDELAKLANEHVAHAGAT
jgi:Patatin-like phospholipase